MQDLNMLQTKVKTYHVLNYLGLNFQKSLKINLGSKGLKSQP